MRLPTGVKNKYLNVYIYIIFLHLPSSTVYSLFISSACAVSAMLRDVAGSCVSHVRSNGVDGEEVNGDMEIDIVLCQSELIKRTLQLCHLLPPGFMPVRLNSYHTHTLNMSYSVYFKGS